MAVAALALTAVVVRGRDGWRAWLGAGLAAGYVVSARPYDALVFVGPLLASAHRHPRPPRTHAREGLSAVVGTVISD